MTPAVAFEDPRLLPPAHPASHRLSKQGTARDMCDAGQSHPGIGHRAGFSRAGSYFFLSLSCMVLADFCAVFGNPVIPRRRAVVAPELHPACLTPQLNRLPTEVHDILS